MFKSKIFVCFFLHLVTTLEEQCRDLVINNIDWRSSSLSTCAMYEERLWCTEDGNYGSGWKPTYGTFQDWAVNGISALEGCCACGGGTTNPKPTHNPTKNPYISCVSNSDCAPKPERCSIGACRGNKCIDIPRVCTPTDCKDGSEPFAIPGKCCEYFPCGAYNGDNLESCSVDSDCDQTLNLDGNPCTATRCFLTEIGVSTKVEIGVCYSIRDDEPCEELECPNGDPRKRIPNTCCEFFPCGYCTSVDDCPELPPSESLCRVTKCLENSCRTSALVCDVPLCPGGSSAKLVAGSCCEFEPCTCEQRCTHWPLRANTYWAVTCEEGEICSPSGCCKASVQWDLTRKQWLPPASYPGEDILWLCQDIVLDKVLCPSDALLWDPNEGYSNCSCTRLLKLYECDDLITPTNGNLVKVSDLCQRTCQNSDCQENLRNCRDRINDACLLQTELPCTCKELLLEKSCASNMILSPWGTVAVADLCSDTCGRCALTPGDPACRDIYYELCFFLGTSDCSCSVLLQNSNCGEIISIGSRTFPVEALCAESCGRCANETGGLICQPCGGLESCGWFLDEKDCLVHAGCVWLGWREGKNCDIGAVAATCHPTNVPVEQPKITSKPPTVRLNLSESSVECTILADDYLALDLILKNLNDAHILMEASYKKLLSIVASRSSQYTVHSPTITQTPELLDGSSESSEYTNRRQTAEYMNLEYIIEVPKDSIDKVQLALQKEFRDELEYLARINGVDVLGVHVESRKGIKTFSLFRLSELILTAIIIFLLGIILRLSIVNSKRADDIYTRSPDGKEEKVKKVREEIPSLYTKELESKVLILHPPSKQQVEEQVTSDEEHIPLNSGSFRGS